jgi:hypothetical protein
MTSVMKLGLKMVIVPNVNHPNVRKRKGDDKRQSQLLRLKPTSTPLLHQVRPTQSRTCNSTLGPVQLHFLLPALASEITQMFISLNHSH